MKKLTSIILILFMFTSCAEERKPPIHDPFVPSCEVLKEDLSKTESEIYELYKILTEDEKFSSHDSLEKKFYGTNSLFIYWPTFDFRKDRYKPIPTPINQLVKNRRYCLGSAAVYDFALRSRCYLDREISYDEFIAIKSKTNENFQNDFEEALIKANNEAKLKAVLRPLDRYIRLSWRVEKLQSQIKRRLTSPRLCYYKPPKDVLDALQINLE